MQIKISREGMEDIIIDTEQNKPSKESLPNPEKEISLDQMKDLIKTFGDRIKYEPWSEQDINTFENETNFKLGEKTAKMLREIGNLMIGNFEVPRNKDLYNLTQKWRETVATQDQMEEFVVIEADGNDFTLVNARDEIYIYHGDNKTTSPDGTDVISHISKHIMAKIAGLDY